jgi:hypothetical protein
MHKTLAHGAVYMNQGHGAGIDQGCLSKQRTTGTRSRGSIPGLNALETDTILPLLGRCFSRGEYRFLALGTRDCAAGKVPSCTDDKKIKGIQIERLFDNLCKKN